MTQGKLLFIAGIIIAAIGVLLLLILTTTYGSRKNKLIQKLENENKS